MRSKKVTVAAAAALGVSLLLAGCGGGAKIAADGAVTQPQNSAAPSTPAQPSASATPSTASGADAPMTDLRARMLAVAGVLQPTDFPGYDTEVQEDDETDAFFDTAMYKCLGAKQPTYLAENPGKSYTKDGTEIISSVDVVRTAKEALADLRVFTGGKGESCLEQTTKALAGSMGVTVTEFDITMSPVTVKGADEAFKVFIKMTLSGPGGSLSSSGWTIGAVVGGTQIGMDVSSEDGDTPKLGRAVELAELAVKRVKQAQTAPESDADPEVAHLGKATGPQLGA